MPRPLAILAAVITAAFLAPAAYGDATVPGALSQLAGEDGCYKGTAGKSWIRCKPYVRGMWDVSSVAVSPDGNHAYAVSLYSSADGSSSQPGGTLVAFARNKATGRLTQLPGVDGCIRDVDAPSNGVTLPCTLTAKGLSGAKTVAVSPDGKHVYVAALNNAAIAAFSRNPLTGAVRQLAGSGACVQEHLEGDLDCPVQVKGIHGIRWLTVSLDGKHVYAASSASDAIAAFARNPTTGVLTQLAGAGACIEDRKARPRTNCPSTGIGLNHPRTITVSPDGKSVYVASNSSDKYYNDPTNPANGDAVSAFARNPTTGVLTQLSGAAACIEDRQASSSTECPTVGRGLYEAFHVTVSPDSKHVYVSSHSHNTGAIAVFARNPLTGALTQLAGRDGWISGSPTCLGFGDCTVARGMTSVDALTITKNGSYGYAASFSPGQVVVFSRNATLGTLTQFPDLRGCLKDPGSSLSCTPVFGKMLGPRIVALSPDDVHAYVPASSSGTLLTFIGG